MKQVNTQVRETRGRKPLAPRKKRKPASYTLPAAKIERVFRESNRIGVPASRFVEFAVDVALRSCDDPDYCAAVKAAAKATKG